MDNLQLLKTILSNVDIQRAINSSNFEDAYEKVYEENALLANTKEQLIIPLFTEILYNAGIDPLKYLKHIPKYFAFNSKKTLFYIPNRIETIGNSAFAYCENLKSITIPKSCNEIETYCFLNCTNLKDVIIESPNIKIGIGCFYMCRNIKNVTCVGTFKDFNNILGNFPMTHFIVFHCSDGNYAYDDHYNLRKIK